MSRKSAPWIYYLINSVLLLYTKSHVDGATIPSLPWACNFEGYQGQEWCGMTPEYSQYQWLIHRGLTPSKNTGPLADHTMGDQNGHYAYVEASPVEPGTSARLTSSTLPDPGRDKCLSFYLSVHGMHTGTMLVEAVSTTGQLTETYRYVGDWETNVDDTTWHYVETTLPAGTAYFNFRAIRGGTSLGEPYGDMAVDDLRVVWEKCPNDTPNKLLSAPDLGVAQTWPGEQENLPKYEEPSSVNCEIVKDLQKCDFDISPPQLTDQCNFYNDPNDDLAWLQQKGPTPTENTGPSSDHTIQDATGFYLYLEATTSSVGQVARLFSPDLSNKQGPFCLTFYYHMFGETAGTLSVFEYRADGSRQQIWGVAGNKGNIWRSSEAINISEGVQKIAIEARRGGSVGASDRGDIAIDDVLLRYPSCSSIENCKNQSPPVNVGPPPTGNDGTVVGGCNFELTECGFVNEGNVFMWLHNKGPTPTEDTGPNTDHTTGNENGYYMYTEASLIPANAIARLRSPSFGGVGPYCLSFWYFMYGHHIGIFTVRIIHSTGQEAIVWSKTGDESTRVMTGWHQVLLNLPVGTQNVILQHQRLPDQGEDRPHGDLAVDDIAVTTGGCTHVTSSPDQNIPPPPNAWVGENGNQQPPPPVASPTNPWVGENGNQPPQQPPPPPPPPPPSGNDWSLNTGFEDCETEGAIIGGCNFDQGNLCGFYDGNGDFPWSRTSGGTPTTGTGPSKDHTVGETGAGTGFYMYAEVTGRFPGQKALLSSPYVANARSVQFWFFMQGQDVGTLSIRTSPGSQLVWSRSGNQGTVWQLATVALPDGTQYVLFEATRGGVSAVNDMGDIAIDDIIIREQCQASDNPNGWGNEPAANIQNPEACGKDPCQTANCDQICQSSLGTGTYQCDCVSGYRLAPDGHTCNDIDECVTPGRCASGSRCYNAEGGFVCVPLGINCPKKK